MTSRRYALVMSAFALVNFLPGGTMLAGIVAPLACSAAIAAGQRRHSPDRAWVWSLLAWATALFGVGGVVAAASGLASGGPGPMFSVADTFYLAGYAVLAAGVLAVLRSRLPRRPPGHGLDAAVLLIALGVAIQELMVEPLWYANHGWARVPSVLYPLMGAVMVLLVARLLALPGTRPRAAWLLTASLAAAVGGDLALAADRLHDPATQGTLALLPTLFCYALGGLAALHPSMVELTRPVPLPPPRFHPLRAVGLWAALVTPAAVAVIAQLRHDEVDTPILFLPTAVIALLGLIRLRGLFAERQRLDTQVAAREAYYHEILSHTANAVAVVGPEGPFRYTNPVFATKLALGPEDVLLDLVHPDDRNAAEVALSDAVLGANARCELRPARGQEHSTWFDTTFSPLPADGESGRSAVLVVMHDITERRNFEAELRHQTLHDGLTGLPNRLLLMDRLDQSLSRGRRRNAPPALLFVDLDHFKTVNDSLGHAVGDRLLRAVADRLRGAVREEDTVVRLGGDEFAVLVESPQGAGGPEVVADRLLQMLRPSFDLTAGRVTVSASIGIATAGLGTSGAELLREADLAMYRAKAAGRNGFAVFRPEMSEAVAERMRLETDLGIALAEEQFHLLYQPIMDLGTGTVKGVEALVRWDHPVDGRITPDRFIAVAEENGAIADLGRWVLREATRAAARMPAPLYMSVNVSPRQLASDRFVADVEAALEQSGIEPRRLVLEITESMLMHDMTASTARLGALKELGVHLAVDDFGTGYSSLAYLQQFPIDVLKIDRSFITPMTNNPEAGAIVRALVEMGRALGLRTVAEGVERPEQADRLQQDRCDFAQGYLYSKPIELEAFETFLAVHGPSGSGGAAVEPLVPREP